MEWAKKDLDIRQDVYTYDTLAWAFYHNDLFEQALHAITNSLALGTKNPTLFYHAGMIRYRLGNWVQAKTWLEKTLTTNPKFSNAKHVKETLHLLNAGKR